MKASLRTIVNFGVIWNFLPPSPPIPVHIYLKLMSNTTAPVYPFIGILLSARGHIIISYLVISFVLLLHDPSGKFFCNFVLTKGASHFWYINALIEPFLLTACHLMLIKELWVLNYKILVSKRPYFDNLNKN